MPGETRIVTRTDVSKVLGTASVPDVEMSGAAQVRISRSSRPLAEADVVPVLRSHVAAITVWRPEEIEIRAIGNLKGVEIPDGNITFRFAQKSAPSNFRNLLLPLEVSVDGRPVRTVWVTADVRINATVMQAARSAAVRSCAGRRRCPAGTHRDPRSPRSMCSKRRGGDGQSAAAQPEAGRTDHRGRAVGSSGCAQRRHRAPSPREVEHPYGDRKHAPNRTAGWDSPSACAIWNLLAS